MCRTSSVILRWTCAFRPLVQDAATDTIPDDITQIDKKRFGYHETYDWYQKCKVRSTSRAGLP